MEFIIDAKQAHEQTVIMKSQGIFTDIRKAISDCKDHVYVNGLLSEQEKLFISLGYKISISENESLFKISW